MPLKLRTLNVVANPWMHLDHQGRPAGACPMDLAEGQKGFVGARIDTEKTEILRSRKLGSAQDHVQDTVWAFETEAVVVPDTTYYRKRLQAGEILPADEAAARAAGHDKFTPPATALETAKKAAIAEYNAMYGDNAFEALAKERDDAAAKAAKPAEADAAKKAEKTPKPTKGDG